MMHYNSTEDNAYIRYNFVSYIVYYSLIIIIFLLNGIADMPPRHTPYSYEEVNDIDLNIIDCIILNFV